MDHYCDCGVSGIFTVCSASEMYELSEEERISLAAKVVDRANFRVPVYACGTFGGSLGSQAKFIEKMFNVCVHAFFVFENFSFLTLECRPVWRR